MMNWLDAIQQAEQLLTHFAPAHPNGVSGAVEEIAAMAARVAKVADPVAQVVETLDPAIAVPVAAVEHAVDAVAATVEGIPQGGVQIEPDGPSAQYPISEPAPSA